MPKPTPWKDEYTLLCERCGYIIEDLDQSLPCPECGKPITESLPERRVGTPWQQKPRFTSLLQTWWMTIRHPIRTTDLLKTSVENSTLRLASVHWSALAGSLSWVISMYLMLVTTRSAKTSKGEDAIAWFIAGIGGGLILYFGLAGGIWVLISIEEKGIRTISNARKFRLPHSYARSICDHGAIGWVLATAFGGIASILVILFESKPNIKLDSWMYLLPLVSALPGFLFFETFAYLGLRRCKYANRSRPNPDPDRTHDTLQPT
ncbi:MAG: hypothetical protein JJ974_07000 [Phycisphaerales bacterium]|nr:hypothetical protein [Phycisphaerales bacterium]